jgi:uncharacterized protein YjbI with pentapeptide repeats
MSEATLLRVRAVDCRFVGADLAQAVVRWTTFVDCRFDEASLRLAKLEHVRFERCALAQADFTAAQLTHTAFPESDCSGADFTQACCDDVDLRDARLERLRGIASLRGAMISRDQIVPIAPDLAVAMGLLIADDRDT